MLHSYLLLKNHPCYNAIETFLPALDGIISYNKQFLLSRKLSGRGGIAATEENGSSSLKKRRQNLVLQQLRALIKALKVVLELMAR